MGNGLPVDSCILHTQAGPAFKSHSGYQCSVTRKPPVGRKPIWTVQQLAQGVIRSPESQGLGGGDTGHCDDDEGGRSTQAYLPRDRSDYQKRTGCCAHRCSLLLCSQGPTDVELLWVLCCGGMREGTLGALSCSNACGTAGEASTARSTAAEST